VSPAPTSYGPAPRPRPCGGCLRSGLESLGERAPAPCSTRHLWMTPVDLAMVDTLERFPQPLQPYLYMIEASRMDLPPPHRTARLPKTSTSTVIALLAPSGWMTHGSDGSGSRLQPRLPGAKRPDTPMPPFALGIANQAHNILRMWAKTAAASYVTCPRRIWSDSIIQRLTDGRHDQLTMACPEWPSVAACPAVFKGGGGPGKPPKKSRGCAGWLAGRRCTVWPRLRLVSGHPSPVIERHGLRRLQSSRFRARGIQVA